MGQIGLRSATSRSRSCSLERCAIQSVTAGYTGSDDRLLAKVPRDMAFNLVGGAEDPATAKGKAVKDLENRMRKHGFIHVTTKIYEDTRHEGLNEINRELIMQDFADWARQVAERQMMKLKSA